MNSNIKKLKTLAEQVYKALGSGHSESVYQKAMEVALRLAGIRFEAQKVVELCYKDHYVGEGYLDIIAHFGKQKLILELKSTGGALGPSEEQQIRHYMKKLGVKHGLLINFQQPQKKGKAKIEMIDVSS